MAQKEREKTKQTRIVFATMVVVLASIYSFALRAADDSSEEIDVPQTEIDDESTHGGFKVKTALEKIVDNQGNGFERLYGTRNVRAVLKGFTYRSGANNYFHRAEKRPNKNPMPNDGLENLCKEGFTRVVYLYKENFNSAPKEVKCRTRDGRKNRLEYLQINGLTRNEVETKKLLGLIREHLMDSKKGRFIAHCWNGWHASGFVAAVTLRQFCGFSGEEAVSYWDTATDGNNQEPAFERIRQRIRDFKPSAELEIPRGLRAKACPHPRTLAY